MVELANAAGTSRPALYQHDKNNSDIFRAFVQVLKLKMISNLPDPSLTCARLARVLVNAAEGTKMRAGSVDQIEAELRAIIKLIVIAANNYKCRWPMKRSSC